MASKEGAEAIEVELKAAEEEVEAEGVRVRAEAKAEVGVEEWLNRDPPNSVSSNKVKSRLKNV